VEGQKIKITDLPNEHHLRPQVTHAAHKLYGGIFLVVEKLMTEVLSMYGYICDECLDYLGRNVMPSLSLAN